MSRCLPTVPLSVTAVIVWLAFNPFGIGQVPTASTAPASVSVGDVLFSPQQGNPPNNPRIEFDSSTGNVWAYFSYNDYGGEKMSHLIRANGEDWQWGKLDCCQQSSGGYSFEIERRSGRDLGGAAYAVFIYANDVEVAHGGFGVKGTQGFDSGDPGGNDNN